MIPTASQTFRMNGVRVELYEGKPEDHTGEALLVPEDCNLVMGPVEPLDLGLTDQGDYVLHRMAVEAAQAAPQALGNIVKQSCRDGRFPLVLKLVVYDFDRRPFVEPLWVRLTLSAALRELNRQGVRSLCMGALGCSHGGLSPYIFGTLLVDTLLSLPMDGSLTRMNLCAAPLALRTLAHGVEDQLRLRLH